MTKRTGSFIVIFFLSVCFKTYGQQCLQEFLDSVNQKIIPLHDGRYHATFTFSDMPSVSPVNFEGTCYFSKDSASFGSAGDFIVFEHDTIPLFAYTGQHFYKFDAIAKKYTSQYLRRSNFYAKSSYEFQHFLAVSYLLTNEQYPFDNDLMRTGDSLFCDCTYAGYMNNLTLKSQQYGEEHMQSYHSVKRSNHTDTLEIAFKAIYPKHEISRIWLVDSMMPFANAEAFINKKVNETIKAYTLSPSKDLDDTNWVAPPAPLKPGEKLILDTLPVMALTTPDGANYTLDKVSGKLLLLHYWWSRSEPATQTLAGIQDIFKKYSSNGLTVIGIDPYDLDMDAVKASLQKAAISYPDYIDADAATAIKLGIYIFPTIILADPVSRKIYFTHVGTTDLTDVERIVKERLGLK